MVRSLFRNILYFTCMIAILAPSPGGEKGPHLVLRDSEARGIINTLNSTLVSASLAPHAETLSQPPSPLQPSSHTQCLTLHPASPSSSNLVMLPPLSQWAWPLCSPSLRPEIWPLSSPAAPSPGRWSVTKSCWCHLTLTMPPSNP